VEMASVAAHPEDSNKNAAVETVGALKDRYGDRNLALGHPRQPKKRTQIDGGFRQKLSAARGRSTCRAIRAQSKGHGRQGSGRHNVGKQVLKRRAI
jgi:hypothetical protein